ncbi:primosomal protein N' [Fulvivirga lutea]|uniref:Replication restart protein PriA n=1 Tax=Fulvivirga lutea TaxID=2810512 RepID=A0A974WLH7_9BACT|nr:primosomal protein N' [Fulvivirga lutea]QSE99427.1 primosomal protein N' [Fulvivirga lutea]
MFTYRSPADFNDYLQVGCRVIVQFGSRKIMTGIIGAIHTTPPQKYEAKSLLDILDQEPIIHPPQIKLFQWIADYYMCTLGEVMNVAIPSGLKLSSESRVQLYPDFDLYDSDFDFSDNELLLIEILEKNESLTYSEIGKALQIKNSFSIIKSLVQKDAVIIYEEIKEKYKPKKQRRIRLKSEYEDKKVLESLFKQLESQPKQEELLLAYLQHMPIYKQPELNSKGIEKSLLQTAELSASSLKTLIRNNILEEFEITISRFEDDNSPLTEIKLTENQQHAKNEILDSFKTKDTALLHGITGSGKTEIYISLIKDALESESQVLYLLPEIALTTQIVIRLKKVFGNKVGIYHSKFSDNERVEVWNGVLSGRYQLVLGVRSSIFLPFDNLGMIIVDEEHESSYKQYDPAPRYNARDVALFMAKQHHAKVLLGSATPSLESYFQAKEKKYGLIELNRRYGEAQLPSFEIADMLREGKKKTLKGEFSSLLINHLNEILEKKEQAIIFQNRRGYSPYISCEQCANIPKCTNCAVSLTYHQYKKQLICHYCGYHEPMPNECEACGSKSLKTIGVGTEKLEEDLELLIPEAKIQRMDLDTTRNKNSYERIITDFENQEIDILVGTQMVTKGLDFDHVSLVGVFDIDRMLHFPDFRAYERTFQLTTQVSGRAGRREKKGKVVIQARNVELPILKDIISNNYLKFYDEEIREREMHRYPPFTRLIGIRIKNKDKNLSHRAANRLSNLLKEQLGSQRVLGPQEPVINKIRNEYLVELLIKLERGSIDLNKVKQIIQNCSNEILNEKDLKSSKIVFDVDPY